MKSRNHLIQAEKVTLMKIILIREEYYPACLTMAGGRIFLMSWYY